MELQALTRMRCRTSRSSKRTTWSTLKASTSCVRCAVSTRACRAVCTCTWVGARRWSGCTPRRSTSASSGAMSSPEAAIRAAAVEGDFRAVGERINALLDASASGGGVAKERAEELVRLRSILYALGRLDDEALAAVAADDLVSSLLLVHDLHPYDIVTRVEQALDNVRPYLGSHGGDVELLSVSEDVVRLRLLGSCDGCPSSSVTLKLAV